MVITNFTASVSRACIMGIIGVFANLVYRKQDLLTTIAISLLIILIINPFKIQDIGLELSYLGTIGIVLLYKRINSILNKKIPSYISKILAVSISAQIMIMPITVYNFNTLSLNFFISNFLVSPVLLVIIILGLLTIIVSFISLSFSKIMAIFLNFCLNILDLITKTITKIPFGNINNIVFNTFIVILVYFIIFIIYSNNKRIIKSIYFKVFAILVLIIIVFNQNNINIQNNLYIHFIDVGQGDSTLIITPHNKKILIDGGEGKLDVLVPYLLNRRIKKIDYIIISHFDSDHIGGLYTVMEKIKVGRVVISSTKEVNENYEKFKDIVIKNHIKVVVVEKQDRINIEEDLYFDILWPNSLNVISENILNNNSIVCKLCYKEFSILFTGDIEKTAEAEILKECKDNLKSTVLKVAHHGSDTSSTQGFINAVNPNIALIEVGENNKFGHPNDEVVERLENIGTKIYRTDQMGEITIIVNKKIRIKKFIK